MEKPTHVFDVSRVVFDHENLSIVSITLQRYATHWLVPLEAFD